MTRTIATAPDHPYAALEKVLVAGFAWRGARVGYTHVVRTREFKTQGKHDEFGAFSLSMSF